MAVGAADGILDQVDLVAVLVEVLGPEAIALSLEPDVHLRRLAVHAGRRQTGLLTVAVDPVDVEDVLHRVGVTARRPILVTERVAEPEVLQVGLGMIVAFGQRVDVIMLVVGHGAVVLGHDLRFVVALVGLVVQRELGLEGGVADLVGGQSGLELRGPRLGRLAGTAGQDQDHSHRHNRGYGSQVTHRRHSSWLLAVWKNGGHDGGNRCSTACSASPRRRWWRYGSAGSCPGSPAWSLHPDG